MDTADLHICGTCKHQFSQIEEFVQHKKTCRPNSKNKTGSHTSEEFGTTQSLAGQLHPLENSSNSDLDISPSIIEVVNTPSLSRSQYGDSNQRSLDASAAILQAQSAHNLQLLDNIRMQMQQLQQQPPPVGTAQQVTAAAPAALDTGSQPQVQDVVQMEVVCQGGTQSEPLTIPQIQHALSDASKPTQSQSTYQNVVPVLQLSDNTYQLTTESQGQQEIQVITIPVMPAPVVANSDGDQCGSSRASAAHKASAEGPLLEPPSCKKGKYTRHITRLQGATSSTSTLETGQQINGTNLPKGMIERYIQEELGRTSQFSCSHPGCTYTTLYAKNVERHMALHTGVKQHNCTECNTRFSRLDKLKVHMRCHTGEKPYKCNMCDYKCADSSSLKKHSRIHTNEKPYKCQFCSHASRSSSQLTQHLRTHTGDKPFMCPVCSMRFKVKTDMKRHLRLHTGERPFACHLCDVKTTVKCNLLAHMRVYHDEARMTQCKHCDYKTSSKRALKAHYKQHTLDENPEKRDKTAIPKQNTATVHRAFIGCSQCRYVTSNTARLKQHIKNLHSDSGGNSRFRRTKGIEPAGNLQGRAEHQCPKCELSFVRADSLRSHLRSHKSVDEYAARMQRAESNSQSESENSNEELGRVESVSSDDRIAQEHEYAAVKGPESCAQQNCEDLETAKTIASDPGSPSPCRHDNRQPQAVTLTERQKLQNLLPYIENNHNMAVWDNMQNMAISDRHDDEPQRSTVQQSQPQLSQRTVTSNRGNNNVVQPQESNHRNPLPVIGASVDIASHIEHRTTLEPEPSDTNVAYMSTLDTTNNFVESQTFSEPTHVTEVVTNSLPCENTMTLDCMDVSDHPMKIESSGNSGIQGSDRSPATVPLISEPSSNPNTSHTQPATLAATAPMSTVTVQTTPPTDNFQQTPSQGPVTTLTPLSSLPANLQTILNSLNLARGQVITVPVGEQRVHILVDTTAAEVSASVGGSLPAVQLLTPDTQNNNPTVTKNITPIDPVSATPQSVHPTPCVPQGGEAQVTTPQDPTTSDPPQLQLAQPLYLMSEGPNTSTSADC